MDMSPIRERTRDGVRERFCKTCENWWPLPKFVKNAKGKGGYLGKCKLCRNEDKRMARAKYVPRSAMSFERAERLRTLARARYRRLVDSGLNWKDALWLR